MANDQASFTNRKLNFAKIQLSNLELLLAEDNPHAAKTACALESVIYFLGQAYISLLGEIATAYRHNGDRISNLSDLHRAMEARGLQPIEVSELDRLEAGPSWLSQLLEWNQNLLKPDLKEQFRLISTAQPETPELQLIDVAERQQPWPDRLAAAVKAFEGLAERLREATSEY